jgi:Fur family transcriptional regulator, stress-responsive regulator
VRHEAVKGATETEGLLRRVGLRVTRPRLTVLEVVARASGAHEHVTTAEVADRAREGLTGLSTQAVYDCLDALTDVGLLRRVQLPGSPARYETRVADNHHHLVCRSCGAIADVDCAVGEAPCLDPSDVPAGFELDEADVTYWGLCSRCAGVRPSERPHRTSPSNKSKES